MAGRTPKETSRKGKRESYEADTVSGVVVRDSFTIVETLKVEAGFTVYRTRFKVSRYSDSQLLTLNW